MAPLALALFALLLSCASASPTPFPCAFGSSANGARQAWINELAWSNPVAVARAVEVAVPMSSSLSSGALLLEVLTPSGAVLSSTLLSSCTTHVGNVPWAVAFFVCDDTQSLGLALLSTGGGVAVSSIAGTARTVLHYVSVGASALHYGAPPCILPDSVLAAPVGANGTSLQWVSLLDALSGAPIPSAIDNSSEVGFVAVATIGIEAGLPQTFGGENNGVRAIFDPLAGATFVEIFVQDAAGAALAPQPAPSNGVAGLIAALSTVSLSSNATPPSACVLGGLSSWSACSSACGVGVAVQWQLVTALGPSCAPISARSVQRICNGTAQCSFCNNLVRDGNESDVDCGGGIAASGPYSSIQDAIAAVSAPSRLTPLAPPGACPRCALGRSCASHEDCALAGGLACLPRFASGGNSGVCAPWLLYNTTFFAQFNVSALGLDPNELDAAMGAFTTLIAVAAGADAVNTSVAIWSETYFAAAGLRRVLRHQRDSTSARSLASPQDTLTFTVLVAAPLGAVQASLMAANLAARTPPVLALAVSETLRPFAPLVSSVSVSPPVVAANPFIRDAEAVVVPVPSPAPVPPPSTPLGDPAVSNGFSPGIYVGIALAACLAIALCIAAAHWMRRCARTSAAEAHAARTRRLVGRGMDLAVNQGTPAVATLGSAALLEPDAASLDKRVFSPHHVARGSGVPGGAPTPSNAAVAQATAGAHSVGSPDAAATPGGTTGSTPASDVAAPIATPPPRQLPVGTESDAKVALESIQGVADGE